MTAKKSIALLIALAMAVAMLAGCSSGTPTDANDPAPAGDGSAAATGDERTPATFSLLQMAAATMVTIPLILAFVCFRRYILSGVVKGGIKG